MFSKKFAMGLGVVALAAASGVAQAQTAAPTRASLLFTTGPFTIASQTIPGNGFGGATVFSPTAAGTYPIIALSPGFTARRTSVQQIGMKLARHGFVVGIIDTNSTTDFPDSRATQLRAALRSIAAINTGPAAGKINPNLRGIGGHSMGGGGATIALNQDRTIRAAVAFAPFVSGTRNFTAVANQGYFNIVGTADNVAPANNHSTPIVNSIIVDNPTLMCIQSGATHSTYTGNTVAQPANLYSVAMMKTFLANDARFRQFLVRETACSTFRTARLQ